MAKARHAAAYADDQGASRRFRKTWINTGVARECKGVACFALFNTRPTEVGVEAGEVHIRLAAAYTPARGKQPPASGWALTAHDVAADGSEEPRLRARGAVPATATHGSKVLGGSVRAARAHEASGRAHGSASGARIREAACAVRHKLEDQHRQRVGATQRSQAPTRWLPVEQSWIFESCAVLP